MFIMPASMLQSVFMPSPPDVALLDADDVSCWLICAMEVMGSKDLFIPIAPEELGVEGLRGVS